MVRNNCGNFSGTSASAAVASGIIALVLEANFNLTWRDVQYIIVMSSSLERITTDTEMTETNGIGLRYNTWFGFGIMNATSAVLHALKWNTVPAQMNYTMSEPLIKLSIQKSYATLMRFPSCTMNSTCMRYVEQVRVHIDYQTSPQVEDQLEIVLFSPAQTCSTLFRRKGVPNNDTKLISRNWNYTAVQFWGENPQGHWILIVRLKRNLKLNSQFLVRFVTITVFGAASNPYPKDYIFNVNSEKEKNDTDKRNMKSVVSIALQQLDKRSNRRKKELSPPKMNDNIHEGFHLSSFLVVLFEMLYVIFMCFGVFIFFRFHR